MKERIVNGIPVVGALYRDGEKIADVHDISMGDAQPFVPPDWYPHRNVAGSSPYVNVRGCWFCGDKIERLNGMCGDCAHKRPWSQPNAFTVLAHMQVLHAEHPDWWLHYIGGPHACIGCGASDNVGAVEHNPGCPVVSVITQLEAR
jgi:hypothetical protein